MFNSSAQQRLVLHTGMALSLSLIAIGGCSTTPATAPALSGSEQAHAFPGTTGAIRAENAYSLQALSLVASASASASGTLPANAVDGNTSTAWGSGPASASWLLIDRGAPGSLTGLKIKMAPNIGYTIQVSADGKTFQTALAGQKNTTWNLESKVLPAGTAARFIKLAIANNGQNAMVFELQPQGSTASPAPAPAASTPATVGSSAPAASPAPLNSAAPLPPTSTPVPAPANVPVATGGPTIVVDAASVLHPATTHVLATCRNHVAGQFPNGAGKLQMLKALTPTWGEHKYLYRIGHGPQDGRTDYSYMTGFHFEQTWDQNNGYPYDDIRNALGDAATIGADQMHVVNFGTSDPAEAGRYVSFLNKAGDANRAAHPVAQQNVSMFELGNEISWNLVRGHSQYAPDETTYASRAKLFAQAMRSNSDVPIKVGAVVGTNSNFMGNGWSGGGTSVKNILQTMGDQVDFLIFHGYPSWPLYKDGDLQTLMAQNAWTTQKIESEIKPAIKQYANGRDVFLANTEFFSNLYNDVTRSVGMFGALYAADSVTTAMNEDIRTAVEFCFSHGNLGDSQFFLNDDPNQPTAIYKFQKMLAQHWGDDIVKATGQAIPTKQVQGASTSIVMPELGFTAAASGNKVYVMVTNRTNAADVTAAIDVGFKPSSVTAYQLSGASGWDSANADTQTIANPSLAGFAFKHASVTIFEIAR